MADDELIIPFPRVGPNWSDTDIGRVERDLEELVGLPVSLVSSGGDHVLSVRANGLEKLDRLIWILQTGAEAWKSSHLTPER